MKINSITPLNIYTKNYNTPEKRSYSSNKFTPPPKFSQMPSTQQYLAFTGGYSLNLAKTIERLDILAKKNSSLYPLNIREWAGMVLEKDKNTKETLIDIHKDYYSSLKDCLSLKKVKEIFPEFANVKSADEVHFAKGSIFESFKKGELEYFDKDEDFSLQLLKLYWGEGFSLNDLKKYTNGQDLYNTMKKLKIPRVDKDYGHILKFSDPQYNERLTKEMTAKRLEALDRRAQMNDGEPVFIKRGPMSAEHRQHISEGLLKYYREHPEKLLEMSERQKDFYRENPEQAKILSRVATKAWNIFGADRIKAAMSTFMKGKGIKDFNARELENPLLISKPKSSVIKQFWASNEWAKKSFSKNMEYAWKKVKEENNTFYMIDLTPDNFKRKFEKWAHQKGINLEGMNYKFKIYPHKPELNEYSGHEFSKYTPKFIDDYKENNQSTVMANSYMYALFNISKELKEMNTSKMPESTKEFIKKLRFYIKESIFEPGPGLFRPIRTYDAADIQSLYRSFLTMSLEQHNMQIINLFEKNLNIAYDYIDGKKVTTLGITEDMLRSVLS